MSGHLIRDDGGGNHPRFPWLASYRLSAIESRLLTEALRQYQVFTDGQFPPDVARQSLLAQIAVDKSLGQAAPGLNRLVDKARNDQFDCIYVTNLPTERSISKLLSLTIGSSIGKVFNHGSQDDGRLVMEFDSDQWETRTELDWRTDGAWMPRYQRAEWIGLLGIENTPGSHVAYAPVNPVEQTLSSRAKAWLHSRSACFRMPDSGAWSQPRAILSRSSLGHTEIIWPGGLVRYAESSDAVGAVALAELSSEINRQHVMVPLDAGCFLAFSNLRGVYKLGTAGDAYCRFYKTYTRHSLRLLQANGESGPIFSFTEPAGPGQARQTSSAVA